ncbi:hypothetical protein GCM10022276_06450 [Sphingomonas limnosediminicola]|uniref:Uncharacterized protein n=1 Tax=Sphingomonas limnosediminicola TaxID=940133 RepID=A0ABP7KWT7_9SPHN
MDNSPPPPTTLSSAMTQAGKRGWNRGTSSSGRVLGLFVAFHGYCAAFIFVLSVLGVMNGINVSGNLKGAAITGVVAFALIKLGHRLRRNQPAQV